SCIILLLSISTLFPYTTLFRSVFWLLMTLSTSTQHVLYVAEEESRIVGFCLGLVTVHPFVPEVPFVAELGWFVEPAYRTGTVGIDRKSTRLNSSHGSISYAVFC